MFLDYCFRFFQTAVYNSSHFRIYLSRNFFGLLPAFDSHSENRPARHRLKCHWPKFLRHSITSHHVARERRQNREVISCSCCQIIEYSFFCNVTAERYRNIIKKFFARLHASILKRKLQSISRSATAADNRNFMNRISIWKNGGHYRVPRFVIGGNFLFFFIQNMTSPLRTKHHFLYRANEIELRYLFSIFA